MAKAKDVVVDDVPAKPPEPPPVVVTPKPEPVKQVVPRGGSSPGKVPPSERK